MMPTIPDVPSIRHPQVQGKQCQTETKISQLQCFTETGNAPKERSPSQHHPWEVTRLSVLHRNSTGAQGTKGTPFPRMGMSPSQGTNLRELS